MKRRSGLATVFGLLILSAISAGATLAASSRVGAETVAAAKINQTTLAYPQSNLDLRIAEYRVRALVAERARQLRLQARERQDVGQGRYIANAESPAVLNRAALPGFGARLALRGSLLGLIGIAAFTALSDDAEPGRRSTTTTATTQ